MGTADRVRAAIERPTNEASKLLAELQHASDAERLTVIVDSWCRGLASALEELAIGLDELERARDEATPWVRAEAPPKLDDSKAPRGNAADTPAADPGADEEELIAKAQQSRAATEELREAASDER
ncbi:MAG TPA: hypothetical protein VFA97_02925 [Gaiellaceae bacterium]|nr:hypothetical protein [Gaiellaceae bacterium]